MQNFYATSQQSTRLFATLILFLLAPLSMLTFGQSPCSSSVERQVTNAKSTNSDILDDIALTMNNLLNDGSQAAWQLESGATFTENTDRTVHIQGIVNQSGNYATPRRMALSITLAGKSFSPNANGAYNQTGVLTDGWYYFTSFRGTLTGLNALVGGQLSLSLHNPYAFQVGIGANQAVGAEDQIANGANGSFEWAVVSQPTNANLQFTNYVQGSTISELVCLLSGTPATACVSTNPCDNDMEAPVFTISCPSTIYMDLTNTAATCFLANWKTPVATDNCSTPRVTSNFNSGTCFPVGLSVVTYTAADAQGNTAACSFVVIITKSTSCAVSNNVVTKSCSNNLPTLIGTPLASHEYLWLKSTRGCPTQLSQAIVGATGQSYTLPSSPTTTTYFIRYARPIGCTTWGVSNAGNCITVIPNECAPTPPILRVALCDTKTVGCFTVALLSTQTLADDKIAYEFKVTNACKYALSHISFGLPVGIKAVSPQNSYASPNGYNYTVENGTNMPFYSLKFNVNGEGIGAGQSDIFRYVLPANAPIQTSMPVEVKASTNVYNFVINTCSTVNSSLSANYIDIVTKAESNRTRIEWVNNTGYKNDFFTIEKMNALTGTFELLELKNSLQSANPEQYTSYDNNPTEGDNFYRVGVTFNDGTIKYSETKKVNFNKMTAFRVFPNPVIDELNINLTEYVGKTVDIDVYNSFGIALHHQHIDKVTNAIQKLDVNDYPTGHYLIRVATLGKRDAMQQVVIQK